MKRIKKFLLYLVLSLLVLYLGLALLAGMFEEQIGQSLQAQINGQLKTDLQFEAFHLSLLRSFPRLSANFENVSLEDAFGDVLLEAEILSFRINPFSLLGQSIKVQSVRLSDGALRIRYDKRGRANYDLFRESKATDKAKSKKSGTVKLSIQNARLQDVQLIYEDEVSGTEADIQLLHANMSGDFSAEEMVLQTDIALKSRFVDQGKNRYLTGRKIRLEGQTVLRPSEGYYAFNPLQISLEDNEFTIEGELEMQQAFSDYDLRISSEDGRLEGLLLFLPEDAFPALANLKSKGDFFFFADIKGRKTASSMPAIQAEFGLKSGRISSDFLAGDLKEVSFTGHFDNGKAHKATDSRLQITDFKAYLRREFLTGAFSLSNFKRPRLKCSFDGTLPLQALYPAFRQNHISDGMGQITFEQLQLEGRLRDMRQPSRMDRVEVSGRILLDDAGLIANGRKIFFDRGELVLSGNEVRLKGIELEAPGNEWTLEGYGNNLLPALLAPKGNPYAVHLRFSSSLEADQVDLDALLALTKTTEENEQIVNTPDSLSANATQEYLTSKGAASDDGLFSMLDGRFEARIAHFNYEKIEANNFQGQLEFFGGHVKAKGKVEAMGGAFELNGTYFNLQEPYFKGQLFCRDVDVKEFFRQNDNFGQDILQDRHLSGRMESKISFTVPFDAKGNLLDKKLYVLAAVGIKEGELRNFEMLESFSTFVKIEDLRRIRFTNLYNYFEIRNRKIEIPRMYIQSNAMNMTLAGSYDFDYNYTFYLKVNAAQTLANRFKKHDPSLSPIPAKQQGWFNLYYKIWGHLDDYHYKVAKREVRQALAQSDHLKLLLKKRLLEEFGDVDFLQEPQNWDDAIEPASSPADGAPSPSEEDEYFDWEEEGGN